MGRPPFTKWSDTDHSGAIIITTVLGLVYRLVPGVCQQSISFSRRRMLSWANYLYVASMIVGLAQSVIVLVASSHGLGKSTKVLRTVDDTESLRLYHASNLLYILVLGFAKCSATCSVINLTIPNREPIRRAPTRHKKVFGVVTALVVVWTIGSIIALGVQCDPESIGSHRNSCDGTMATWVGICVSDAMTDLNIAAFAASIIWPTNARLQLKLVWYIPFYIRLSVIVLSGVRLATFHPANLWKDPTIAIWLFVALTQVQIFMSLVAVGFPALRKTILDLVTNFGVSEDSQIRSRNGLSYVLSSLKRKSKQDQPQESSSPFLPSSAGTSSNTLIRAGANRTPSDDNSQKGIIRQDEYDVIITTTVHGADKGHR